MKRHLPALIFGVIFILGAGTLVWTQEQSNPVQQPQVQQPQSLSPQQLDNLVAPIALYPDPLLSQVLVASTYPLEVVEAGQWLQRNKNLSGQQLMDAAKQQPWDPSVQALVAVPDALNMLDQDIRWTTDLGNAFLAQQSDVMNAVQQMRTQAVDDGKLNSTPQQTVTTQAQGGQRDIVIEPADPEVIYVPYYDPFYVWGPPVYGFYPPLYYPAFGFGFGPGFDLSLCFGGWGDWGGWGLWGWSPNWFGSTVFINNSFFPRFGFHHGFRPGYPGRSVWVHDPVHRIGVPYTNPQVAARFHGSVTGSRNTSQGGFQTLPRQKTQTPQGYQPRRYEAPQRQNQAPQQRYQAPPPRYQTQQPRNQTPQQRYQEPQQRYQAPRYQAPQPRYQAPQPRYQVPQQRYQAPQQFRSAPQMSTPRFNGGSGGGRGAGGGGSRSSGGGGRRR